MILLIIFFLFISFRSTSQTTVL